MKGFGVKRYGSIGSEHAELSEQKMLQIHVAAALLSSLLLSAVAFATIVS